MTSKVDIQVNITFQNPVPNKLHGFHVHEFGISVSHFDAAKRCASTGANFNPLKVDHGFLTSSVHHVGDLGNLQTMDDGSIFTSIKNSDVQLWGPHSIIGRAFVLHADADDGGLVDNAGSKATGNSGARIACGDIALAKF